jgi:hypothetical protein
VAVWGTAEETRAVLGEESELPVLMDSNDEIGAQIYGVEGVPTAVFVDPEGRIGDVRIGGMTATEMAAAVAGLE